MFKRPLRKPLQRPASCTRLKPQGISDKDIQKCTNSTVNNAKALYAGFSAPDPNVTDIKLYETILSGDLRGNDADATNPHQILDEPTRSDNSSHLVAGDINGDCIVNLKDFTFTAVHRLQKN